MIVAASLVDAIEVTGMIVAASLEGAAEVVVAVSLVRFTTGAKQGD